MINFGKKLNINDTIIVINFNLNIVKKLDFHKKKYLSIPNNSHQIPL